jgi:flagellar biosynthetic protein FlhB
VTRHTCSGGAEVASEDKHAKTEKPTPKRRKEARDEGRVARSPDISGWAATLVATFVIPKVFGETEGRVLGVVAQAQDVMSHPTTAGAFGALTAGLRTVLIVAIPLGIVSLVLALVTNIAQVGRSMSLKAARPKFSRINPKSGIQHLVGTQMLEQLAKQTLKLAVLGIVGYLSISKLMHSVTGAQPVGLAPMLGATAASILSFVRIIALIGVLIGVGDFAFQKHKLVQSMKMTKQEVKDEAKQSDGDPTMKGQLKRRMYQIARSRALAAVRTADVVVTNPTHYAVALQYQPGSGGAPRVVAKGSDALARAMREKALEAEVPIVEDPPLARYLFAVCEVDQQIPGEIYVAVAKLLAFVYALPSTIRSGMVHRYAPSQLPTTLEALAALPGARRERAQAVLAGSAT